MNISNATFFCNTNFEVVCSGTKLQNRSFVRYCIATHALAHTHLRARIRTHARGRSISDSLRIPVGLTTRTRMRASDGLCITPEQCRPGRHQPKYKATEIETEISNRKEDGSVSGFDCALSGQTPCHKRYTANFISE